MTSAGWAQPAVSISLDGTPATVTRGGTSLNTTEPAPTREQSPILIFPSTLAPAPISMPLPILWCRSCLALPVPSRVTPYSIVANNRGLADYQPGTMVQHDPPADHHGRIDIDLKYLARAALQIELKIAPARLEHGRGKAMRLNRLIALEERQR